MLRSFFSSTGTRLLSLGRKLGVTSWKSYVAGLLIALLTGSSSYALLGDGESAAGQTTEETVIVGKQDILSSIKTTGTVSFAREQKLKFTQQGRVTKVHFKEGDTVQAGQIIAELDKTSVLADIRQSQLSLSTSALQLQDLEADKDSQIIAAQNAVREVERQFIEAQNSLAVAKAKLPTDIAGAERDVESKKSAVKQAEAALEQAKITTLQSLGSTAQNIMTDSEDLTDSIYGILVNDASARPTKGNTEIDIYYRLYRDNAQRDTTAISYYESVQGIEAMRAKYGSSLSGSQDIQKLSDALKTAYDVARSVHALADNTYILLQGATDDPHDLTISDINSLKQSATSARNSATGLMEEAETALASLSVNNNTVTSITIVQKEDALRSAESALLSSEENLAILNTQTPGDLQSQEATVAKIQEDYAAKQAAVEATNRGITIDTKLKQNDIAQKSASLQQTSKGLEDYEIEAPFDGIIRRIDYQVGDNLADAEEEMFVVLENPEFIVVTVLLDQVDVVRVLSGQDVHVTFDALNDRTFQGTVDEIDSTPVEQSGVVSYEVSVKLATPTDVTILSGMTATAEIEIEKRESVLAVPNLAIQQNGTTATVRLATGQNRNVETGMTDGRYTEIVSGLNEGDAIISINVTAAQGTQTTTGTQQRSGSFPGGIGGGGGAVRMIR